MTKRDIHLYNNGTRTNSKTHNFPKINSKASTYIEQGGGKLLSKTLTLSPSSKSTHTPTKFRRQKLNFSHIFVPNLSCPSFSFISYEVSRLSQVSQISSSLTCNSALSARRRCRFPCTHSW